VKLLRLSSSLSRILQLSVLEADATNAPTSVLKAHGSTLLATVPFWQTANDGRRQLCRLTRQRTTRWSSWVIVAHGLYFPEELITRKRGVKPGQCRFLIRYEPGFRPPRFDGDRVLWKRSDRNPTYHAWTGIYGRLLPGDIVVGRSHHNEKTSCPTNILFLKVPSERRHEDHSVHRPRKYEKETDDYLPTMREEDSSPVSVTNDVSPLLI